MIRRILLSIGIIIFAVWISLTIITQYSDDDFLRSQNLKQLPSDYINEASEQGKLRVISYKPTAADNHNKTLTKKATVYLPYKYTSANKYDILYLMHGRGGSYKTWLGNEKHPRIFKTILDNMIQNGDIRPVIVVASSLAYEYGTDDMIMEETSREIADDLIPAVESRFSTFTKNTSPDGLRMSRNHRGMAGFSMGGSLTWHMLKDHVDYFRYFIPMSMATYYDRNGYSVKKSRAAAKEIRDSLRLSGYTSKDFEVFAATGNMDHKAKATAMQVYDLTNNKEFIFTNKSFKKGNITFKMWPKKWHSYRTSYPYLYNALIQFFPNE